MQLLIAEDIVGTTLHPGTNPPRLTMASYSFHREGRSRDYHREGSSSYYNFGT